MRTTLTLDNDVAARLERLRGQRPFRELVNEALRRGLDALAEDPEPVAPYRIRAVEGKPLRVDLDNVAQLLAEVEGDSYR